MRYYSIAIDGPAGAGKSTVAKLIAAKLNFVYIDTGAMYRAMGLYLLRNKVDLSDSVAMLEACDEVDMSLAYVDGVQQVILKGENVTGLIRTEEAGKLASECSKNPDIRKKLVELQQKLALNDSVVMDGRDIGTCVLPNADIKIFLTASSKVRAKRRYDELQAKGIACDIDEIEKGIIERDNQDCTREHSPLRRAEDAVLVDTSEMDADGAVTYIINLFRNKINN